MANLYTRSARNQRRRPRIPGWMWAALAVLLVLVLICVALVGVLAWRNVQMESGMQQQDQQIAQLQQQILQNDSELQTAKQEKERLAEQVARLETELEAAKAEPQPTPEPVQTIELSLHAAGEVLGEYDAQTMPLDEMFLSFKIEQGDAVYNRIYGKSYVDNEDIGLSDLRYLKVLHYNFEHRVQVGELIVSADLEKEFLEIFRELFEAEYEIYSMYLIDNFWTGDGNESDTASVDANNSSAFCYRRVTGGSGLSNHALGRAIDINPQQNPYVTYRDGKPRWSHSNADDYIDRDSGLPHVITEEDECYKIFKAHGFEWGGAWDNPKDYQHFQKK